MKSIYIVLIKAHTGIGELARAVTQYEYTHIAVCLDKRLRDFITYSRRRHYVPFDAGFMHEYRDYYAYGKHRSFKVKVFEIPVHERQYEDIMRFISQCENDSEQLFNLFSMATMPVFHGFRVYKTHNCMSFTAKVIGLSGAVIMEKPYYKYSIKDMDTLLARYALYEGYLKRIPSDGYEQYMEKADFMELVRTGMHTVFALSVRMLFGRGIEE